MAGFVLVFAALGVAVSAAPPASPRLYQQQSAQLQQINALDYYLDHPELHNYYSEQQQQQKQAASQNHASRLETLEPDSEVELIPGAQQPQQPPQQPPQNIPGLIPGQRVFIIHMPIPGIRPGTIGGYQPVYVVAAGPQGNPAGFPGNGYHNAVLLNPSNQGVTPLGYPGGIVQGQPGLVQGHPGLVQGQPGLVQNYPGFVQGHPGLVQGNPLLFGGQQLSNRPFGLIYQDPAAAHHPAGPQAGPNGNQAPVRLAQLVNLQTQPIAQAHSANPQASESSAESKQQSQAITESKEARNLRPTSAHAQARPKA